MITFDEFQVLARDANVIPLGKTIVADMHTPVSTYLTLREGSTASFLFESVEPNEKVGRFSFVGINPIAMIRARGRVVEIRENGKRATSAMDIFDAAGRVLSEHRAAKLEEMPGFIGGLVGYIGYNNVSHLERIPLPEPTIEEEDDGILGLFPTIVRFDHRHQVIMIAHNVIVDIRSTLREQYDAGRKIIDAVELRLRGSAVATHNFACEEKSIREEVDRDRFCASVRKAKTHIIEGDIFQIVLSRRLRLGYSGDPFPVYRALRMINPSPYLFFVDFGDTKLIGSSPEVLLRVEDGVAEVFPIAGTRRRGTTEDEDNRLEAELLADDKECAEHIMLVDLGRNDVGRVSEFGTVQVPVLKRVERYSHVMHIVSQVRGRLRRDLSALDALKACFPAGTVSGAPKVRAMQIIDNLEHLRRGAYAGAVGYLGFNGDLDTCIAIRTIVAHRDILNVQAGAGIVADSVPETEYEETVSKSRALLDAIAVAANGLTPLRTTVGHRGGTA
jgi:anthranilate synthase component 1